MSNKGFILGLLFVLISPVSFADTLNDNGQISATPISQIIEVKSEADILAAIQDAKKKHLPIAMMGKQHSQGGQTLALQAIELNMLPFNKVLEIDTRKKQVLVQCGITWGELQKKINPSNLAIKAMQSPNIFSVCGSMSVNAHGDDFRAGSVGNSVVGFHLLQANGEKVYVTASTNPELWSAVIGGYGFLGVITDVRLQLTENNWLISHYKEMDLDSFPQYFQKNILADKNVALFYAHVNIAPDSSFLKAMYVITYTDTHRKPEKIVTLNNPDKWNPILAPLFNISRQGKYGKKFRWALEKTIFPRVYSEHTVTRNNAMEKPLTFASNHHSSYNADWLQEYFIPLDQVKSFIHSLSKIMLANKVNLLNVTIRYVPPESRILLPYAKEPCFAVVLYFNQSLAAADLAHTKTWTRELIDAAFEARGNYYLPYQNYASQLQFSKGYPGHLKMIELKKKLDPDERFVNLLYLAYFK